MTLGEKIFKARKKNNLKQHELAKKLGVDQRTISVWEKNRFEPSIRHLKEMTKVLDVPVAYWFEDNPFIDRVDFIAAAQSFVLEAINEKVQREIR